MYVTCKNGQAIKRKICTTETNSGNKFCFSAWCSRRLSLVVLFALSLSLLLYVAAYGAKTKSLFCPRLCVLIWLPNVWRGGVLIFSLGPVPNESRDKSSTHSTQSVAVVAWFEFWISRRAITVVRMVIHCVPCAHGKSVCEKQEILQHFFFICCVSVFFYFGENVICQEFLFYFCQPYRTNTPRLFYNVSVRFMKRQQAAPSTNEMLFLKNAVRVNISLSPVVRVRALCHTEYSTSNCVFLFHLHAHNSI